VNLNKALSKFPQKISKSNMYDIVCVPTMNKQAWDAFISRDFCQENLLLSNQAFESCMHAFYLILV